MTLAGDPGGAEGAGLVSAERLARGPAPGVAGVAGKIRSKIKGIRAGHKRTWQWQMQNAVTTLEQLEEILELTPEERSGAERALAEGFSMRMTPYYIGLASKGMSKRTAGIFMSCATATCGLTARIVRPLASGTL